MTAPAVDSCDVYGMCELSTYSLLKYGSNTCLKRGSKLNLSLLYSLYRFKNKKTNLNVETVDHLKMYIIGLYSYLVKILVRLCNVCFYIGLP